MKKFIPFFLILAFSLLIACGSKSEPLSEQDTRLVQSVLDENQKVNDFLMQTENGLPSLQGLEAAVFALESSRNGKVANLAQKMKVSIQKVNGQNKEEDFQNFSDYSDSLAQILNMMDGAGAYKFHCPMVKKSWIAKGKDVKNPYAPEMRTCGDLITN